MLDAGGMRYPVMQGDPSDPSTADSTSGWAPPAQDTVYRFPPPPPQGAQDWFDLAGSDSRLESGTGGQLVQPDDSIINPRYVASLTTPTQDTGGLKRKGDYGDTAISAADAELRAFLETPTPDPNVDRVPNSEDLDWTAKQASDFIGGGITSPNGPRPKALSLTGDQGEVPPWAAPLPFSGAAPDAAARNAATKAAQLKEAQGIYESQGGPIRAETGGVLQYPQDIAEGAFGVQLENLLSMIPGAGEGTYGKRLRAAVKAGQNPLDALAQIRREAGAEAPPELQTALAVAEAAPAAISLGAGVFGIARSLWKGQQLFEAMGNVDRALSRLSPEDAAAERARIAGMPPDLQAQRLEDLRRQGQFFAGEEQAVLRPNMGVGAQGESVETGATVRRPERTIADYGQEDRTAAQRVTGSGRVTAMSGASGAEEQPSLFGENLPQQQELAPQADLTLENPTVQPDVARRAEPTGQQLALPGTPPRPAPQFPGAIAAGGAMSGNLPLWAQKPNVNVPLDLEQQNAGKPLEEQSPKAQAANAALADEVAKRQAAQMPSAPLGSAPQRGSATPFADDALKDTGGAFIARRTPQGYAIVDRASGRVVETSQTAREAGAIAAQINDPTNPANMVYGFEIRPLPRGGWVAVRPGGNPSKDAVFRADTRMQVIADTNAGMGRRAARDARQAAAQPVRYEGGAAEVFRVSTSRAALEGNLQGLTDDQLRSAVDYPHITPEQEEAVRNEAADRGIAFGKEPERGDEGPPYSQRLPNGEQVTLAPDHVIKGAGGQFIDGGGNVLVVDANGSERRVPARSVANALNDMLNDMTDHAEQIEREARALKGAARAARSRTANKLRAEVQQLRNRIPISKASLESGAHTFMEGYYKRSRNAPNAAEESPVPPGYVNEETSAAMARGEDVAAQFRAKYEQLAAQAEAMPRGFGRDPEAARIMSMAYANKALAEIAEGHYVAVPAKRIAHATYKDAGTATDRRLAQATPDGDIAAAYSADTIMEKRRLRGIVKLPGDDAVYASVGGGSDAVHLIRLHSRQAWGNKPIREKGNREYVDSEHGYEGTVVQFRGKEYIMGGRDEELEAVGPGYIENLRQNALRSLDTGEIPAYALDYRPDRLADVMAREREESSEGGPGAQARGDPKFVRDAEAQARAAARNIKVGLRPAHLLTAAERRALGVTLDDVARAQAAAQKRLEWAQQTNRARATDPWDLAHADPARMSQNVYHLRALEAELGMTDEMPGYNSPERERARDEVLAMARERWGLADAPQTHTLYALGANPGAGKTWITAVLKDRYGVPVIDSDALLPLMIEHGGFPEATETVVGDRVVGHEKSMLAQILARELIDTGRSFILPMSLASEAIHTAKTAYATSRGYSLVGIHIHADVTVAMDRAWARKDREGRWYPVDEIADRGNQPTRVYNQLRKGGAYAEWEAFDNSVNGRAPIRLTAEQLDALAGGAPISSVVPAGEGQPGYDTGAAGGLRPDDAVRRGAEDDVGSGQGSPLGRRDQRVSDRVVGEILAEYGDRTIRDLVDDGSPKVHPLRANQEPWGATNGWILPDGSVSGDLQGYGHYESLSRIGLLPDYHDENPTAEQDTQRAFSTLAAQAGLIRAGYSSGGLYRTGFVEVFGQITPEQLAAIRQFVALTRREGADFDWDNTANYYRHADANDQVPNSYPDVTGHDIGSFQQHTQVEGMGPGAALRGQPPDEPTYLMPAVQDQLDRASELFQRSVAHDATERPGGVTRDEAMEMLRWLDRQDELIGPQVAEIRAGLEDLLSAQHLDDMRVQELRLIISNVKAKIREDVRFAGAQPAEPGVAESILAQPALRPRGYRAGYGLKTIRETRAGTKAEGRKIASIGEAVQRRLDAITTGLERRVNVVESAKQKAIAEAKNAVAATTPRAGIADVEYGPTISPADRQGAAAKAANAAARATYSRVMKAMRSRITDAVKRLDLQVKELSATSKERPPARKIAQALRAQAKESMTAKAMTAQFGKSRGLKVTRVATGGGGHGEAATGGVGASPYGSLQGIQTDAQAGFGSGLIQGRNEYSPIPARAAIESTAKKMNDLAQAIDDAIAGIRRTEKLMAQVALPIDAQVAKSPVVDPNERAMFRQRAQDDPHGVMAEINARINDGIENGWIPENTPLITDPDEAYINELEGTRATYAEELATALKAADEYLDPAEVSAVAGPTAQAASELRNLLGALKAIEPPVLEAVPAGGSPLAREHSLLRQQLHFAPEVWTWIQQAIGNQPDAWAELVRTLPHKEILARYAARAGKDPRKLPSDMLPDKGELSGAVAGAMLALDTEARTMGHIATNYGVATDEYASALGRWEAIVTNTAEGASEVGRALGVMRILKRQRDAEAVALASQKAALTAAARAKEKAIREAEAKIARATTAAAMAAAKAEAAGDLATLRARADALVTAQAALRENQMMGAAMVRELEKIRQQISDLDARARELGMARLEERLRKYVKEGLRPEHVTFLRQLDPTDVEGINGYLARVRPMSIGEMAYAVYINNLLIGLRSISAHGASTLLRSFIHEPLVDVVQAAVTDPVLGKLTGHARSLYFNQVGPMAIARITGYGAGFARMLYVASSPLDPNNPEMRTLAGRGPTLIPPISAFGKTTPRLTLGDPFSFGTRAHVAENELVKWPAIRAEMEYRFTRDARADLIRSGDPHPSGSDVLERADELSSDAVYVNKVLADVLASDIGRKAGFLDSGHKVTKAIAAAVDAIALPDGTPLVGHTPLGRFVVPFINISDRLISAGLELTPPGALYGIGAGAVRAARATNEEQFRAGSRQAASGIVGGLYALGAIGVIAALYGAGLITGPLPTSTSEQDEWEARGKIPFAVRIGDHWYEWGRLEPFSLPFQWTLAALEEWDATASEADQMARVLAVSKKVAATFNDSSYLRGFATLMSAVTAPDKFIASTLSGILTNSVIPEAGFTRELAQWLDAYKRDPKGIVQKLQAGIPGETQNVPPLINSEGAPVPGTGGVFGIMNISTVRQDSVYDAIDALQKVDPTVKGLLGVSNTIGNVKLDDAQYARFQVLAGRAQYDALKRLVDSSAYRGMTNKQRIEQVRSTVDTARRQAKIDMGIELVHTPGASAAERGKGLAISLDGAATNYLKAELVNKMQRDLNADPALKAEFVAAAGRPSYDEYVKAWPLLQQVAALPEFADTRGNPIGTSKEWAQYHADYSSWNDLVLAGKSREADAFMRDHPTFKMYYDLAHRRSSTPGQGGKNPKVSEIYYANKWLHEFQIPANEEAPY